jgi:hypothetical protein
VLSKILLILFNPFDLSESYHYILLIINNLKQFKSMKNLVLGCLTILATITLMSSCGENTATGNATSNATENVVVDSTENATGLVGDTLQK